MKTKKLLARIADIIMEDETLSFVEMQEVVGTILIGMFFKAQFDPGDGDHRMDAFDDFCTITRGLLESEIARENAL